MNKISIKRHIKNWFGVIFGIICTVAISIFTYFCWFDTYTANVLDTTTLMFMYMVSVISTVTSLWFAMMTYYQTKKAINGDR